MGNNLLTARENIHGLKLVAETYEEFKKLAEEQIEKEDDITAADFYDVLIGLLITKLLVAEGKLDEKYFRSATS